MTTYQKYWGKADKNGHHLLPYHCLDVAAVGNTFLNQHHVLRKLLSKRLGLEKSTFVAWSTFFLALHDIGKFSEEFQNLNPKLLKELQNIESNKKYPIRHDSLGFLIWQESIITNLLDSFNLPFLSEYDRTQWEENLTIWAKTVTGHHGQPPEEKGKVTNHFSELNQLAVQEFTQECVSLFLPTSSTNLPEAETFFDNIKLISWWLAGIAVLSDWIGSNKDDFKYHNTDIPLKKYWEYALPHAATALQKAGILPTPQTKFTPELLNTILAQNSPTPLQTLVSTIPISDQPQLFILEDVTGSGKTEAAIILAQRLLTKNLADGFYIGLPTMATSNAMYKRMAEVYQNLFKEKASLILAHGKRDLSTIFRQSFLQQNPTPDTNYDIDDETATAYCTAWLADNRKKSLLADIGIGTLDQALLAILPVKYQSLRLIGLTRKILIVDEVHAYDPYMNYLLKTLLKFHASIGGSAILLSATLPQNMRQELVDNYCKGSSYKSPSLTNINYPLLTHIGTDKTEHPVATRPSVKRSVKVQLIHDKQIQQQIIAASEAGQCVCWIRNTVADAIESYNDLRELIPTDKLNLFHARFAMGDRLDKEQYILDLFDEKSNAEQRQGQVLIATQVVEQSLDLDFDIMFSDLAPMDLLIQRAGRLCRHSRDKIGNRIVGNDERGTPGLFVYSPEPVDEPGDTWLAAFFPRGSFVYANHGQLWLTARLLQEHDIVMPEGARCLIEGVYGNVEIPLGLEKRTGKSDGKQSAQRSIAKLNVLQVNSGYTKNSKWDDDAVILTRLQDEPTVILRLARWDGERLKSWYHSSSEFAWQLSEVSFRLSVIGEGVVAMDDSLRIAIETEKKLAEKKWQWSVLIGLQSDGDNWVGEYVNNSGEVLRIVYSDKFGLEIGKDG